MKILRLAVVGVLLILLVASVYVWWARPHTVDMSDYAPADAVVYLEFNSASRVADAIAENDTWKVIAPALGFTPRQNNWPLTLSRVGIGPAAAVISSRAQLALVAVGMNQTESEDILRIKPEVALIVETQTSNWRLKSVVADSLHQIANFAYGQSECTVHAGDPTLFECAPTGSERKLVAAIDGTVVVIANTEKALQSCLEVRRGLRPSLHTDAEMLRVRSKLGGGRSLAFGYISSANAARLFSWAAPLVLGKPGDDRLGGMLATSAGKILRGIAWTSTPAKGGIEDRLLISLDQSVASRLEPAFDVRVAGDNFLKLIPEGFQSVTIYSISNPVAAWSALDSALALKLDAVSAVLFSSLLRSSLALYGVNDPKELLSSLGSPLLTLKPSADASGSVLIGRIIDREKLRQVLRERVFKEVSSQILEGVQAKVSSGKDFTALFFDDYLLVGKTENVRLYQQALNSNAINGGTLVRFRHFAPQNNPAIVTYANDDQRLTNLISLLTSLKKSNPTAERLNAIRNSEGYWNVSTTETSLSSDSIERKTHSAFGMFSTLLSLVQQSSTATVH